MSRNFIKVVLISLLTFFAMEGRASELSVTAKLDSVDILMGNLNMLRLEVVEPKGSKGEFTIFNQIARQRGYATVCGDSVEIGTNFLVDTTELGSGKIQLNYTVPVQAFDSGTYTLPRFIYKVGRDSAESKNLTFSVYPVNVSPDEEISPLANTFEPDGQRWYDWVPDWIIDFWWIFIILVIVICLGLYGMRNYSRKTLPFISPKPLPKPWDIALDSLNRLKARKLWEKGMEKEYFTELTDILRIYLYERFGINAMEMTTRQIMDKIYSSDLRDKKDYVQQILNVADFVKFAKVRPLPADSISALENARKFVEETIPVENKKEDNQKEGGEA